MNMWSLPGPARFVQRLEHALRTGANVVVRFPVAAPAGFGEHVRSLLHGTWRCAVFHPEPAVSPIDGLRDRFAPRLPRGWDTTLLDLCEHEDFRGGLVWLDGLGRMEQNDWRAWKEFLVDYAQACRSVPEFERTLFVAVLDGAPPADPPQEDVTLTRFDWREVTDEMDLLVVAHDRLSRRNTGTAMRSLLAATVARVAIWDLHVAERLLDEESDVILDPCYLLRSMAHENGWTSSTAGSWELGTASARNGTVHAALASLEDPPRELQRRLWSAQAAVLLPLIDGWRREFAREHRAVLAEHLHDEGDRTDPLDLDVGDLTRLVQRPGFDPEIRRNVRQMNQWRNVLAHLKPLSVAEARLLADR